MVAAHTPALPVLRVSERRPARAPSKHALAKLAAANKFDVVGGLSEAEKEQLASIPGVTCRSV